MSDNFKFVQAQPFALAGAGAVVGATSITLKIFTGIDGALLTMTDFGTIGYMTLEPGNGILEEQISFTGVTQNVNGTATLTGVKSVLFIAPYTETSGLLKTHAGSTTAIISNTSGFYNSLTGKNDDETITGTWTFTAPNYPKIDDPSTGPITDGEFAPKKYVDDIAIAGSPKATNSIYGISKLSVAAVSPTVPIVVGDNDNRVSPVSLAALTAGEVAALPGTSGTPGASNLYLTNLDSTTAVVASSVVRRLASTGDITVPATPGASGYAASKAYVDGQTYITGLGAWASAVADGNGQQVTKDSFLVGYDTAANDANSTTIYSDSASTPTTVRQICKGALDIIPFMIPVKKNEYYKITVGSGHSVTAFVIPIGI